MALILNIDTSTKACSVSLSQNGIPVATKYSLSLSYSHSKLLTVFIEKLFEELSFNIKQLNAVAVSRGPGSYTGLRIGVSVAKGIAYGLGIPLISVDTLTMTAHGFIRKHPELFRGQAFVCPMIDARRMEVYKAVFDEKCLMIGEIKAEIIDENSFADLDDDKPLFLLSDGADKCKTLIRRTNTEFFPEFLPSAEFMVEIADKKYYASDFEDTAYFEPYYLKNFTAVVPTRDIYS